MEGVTKLLWVRANARSTMTSLFDVHIGLASGIRRSAERRVCLSKDRAPREPPEEPGRVRVVPQYRRESNDERLGMDARAVGVTLLHEMPELEQMIKLGRDAAGPSEVSGESECIARANHRRRKGMSPDCDSRNAAGQAHDPRQRDAASLECLTCRRGIAAPQQM